MIAPTWNMSLWTISQVIARMCCNSGRRSGIHALPGGARLNDCEELLARASGRMLTTDCDFRRGLLETARGQVGYIDAGAGTPLLYFHGTGAGNDLALIMERALVGQGFRLIIPNRPGYLDTP